MGNIKILPCNQSIKFFIMIHQALDMYWIRYINSPDETLLTFYGFLISQSFPFFGFYRYKKANSQKQLKVLFVLRQSFLLYNVNCYQLNSIIWSSCIKFFLIYLHPILWKMQNKENIATIYLESYHITFIIKKMIWYFRFIFETITT